MGLPIWRDPEEPTSTKNATKSDPTATARSSIRRTGRVRRSHHRPPPRDPSVLVSHLTRSPSPARNSRRGTVRGVPPISTLLESADRHEAPPPPVPESRNYYLAYALVEPRRTREGANTRSFQEDLNRLERQIHGARHDQGRDTPQQQPTQRRAQTELHLDEDGHVRIRWDTRAAAWRRSTSPYRGSLPTPPMDVSREEDAFLSNDAEGPTRTRSSRGSHPLRNSWSPEPRTGGLGDRNRSPTPADGWEIMRATITPDVTLPSADSSFASAAASQSFGPDAESTTRQNARESEHAADPEDYICYDEDVEATEAFAEDIYFHEMSSYEGRRRIAYHQDIRAREGNRFALVDEPERIDLGFRLIEQALESSEGRDRLARVGLLNNSRDLQRIQDVAQMRRNPRTRTSSRQARTADPAPPSPQPERYSETHRRTVRESRGNVHDYFRRFTADAPLPPPPTSPPQYRRADGTTVVRAHEAGSVSPAGQHTEREAADAIVSGDEVDPMVVERLARQENVPDEWWSSMGLNLSRTRPEQTRQGPRRERRTSESAGTRSSRL